jgi:hypothetical protein
MQGTAETFVCVVCDQELPADKLAFDTDPEHYLGVCTACEPRLAEVEAISPWRGREVA